MKSVNLSICFWSKSKEYEKGCAMKKFITLLILIFIFTLLAGCNPVNTFSCDDPLNLKDISIEYTRTDGYHSDMSYPCIQVIKSENELLEYYQKQKDKFNMDSDFKDRMAYYDESFLKYNVLVIILIQESSGSIRHELESVTTDDDSVIFGIKRIIPEMGTTDMAQWHILISIPSVSYNDEDIKVIFN